MNNKILALGKLLKLSLEEISEIKEIDKYMHNYEIHNKIYKVLTKKEADEEFYDFQQEINDTNGIEGFTTEARKYIEENFIKDNNINWKEVNEWLLQQENNSHKCLSINDIEHVVKFNNIKYYIYLIEE